MRFVLCVLGALVLAWACSGDCMICHAGLDYSKPPHAPMKQCKICHTEEKMAEIDMGGCGQDCFACHSAEKLKSSPSLEQTHRVIAECMECHQTLKLFDSKNLFQGPKPIEGGAFEGWLKSGRAD